MKSGLGLGDMVSVHRIWPLLNNGFGGMAQVVDDETTQVDGCKMFGVEKIQFIKKKTTFLSRKFGFV